MHLHDDLQEVIEKDLGERSGRRHRTSQHSRAASSVQRNLGSRLSALASDRLSFQGFKPETPVRVNDHFSSHQ